MSKWSKMAPLAKGVFSPIARSPIGVTAVGYFGWKYANNGTGILESSKDLVFGTREKTTEQHTVNFQGTNPSSAQPGSGNPIGSSTDFPGVGDDVLDSLMSVFGQGSRGFGDIFKGFIGNLTSGKIKMGGILGLLGCGLLFFKGGYMGKIASLIGMICLMGANSRQETPVSQQTRPVTQQDVQSQVNPLKLQPEGNQQENIHPVFHR